MQHTRNIVIALILISVILLSGCVKSSTKQSSFKVISVKTESGTQTTLVGDTINVSFKTLPDQTVRLDDVSITAREGLTKIEGLSLPPGVTKTAQVVMPSDSIQVCVDDSDNAELSSSCTESGEVIVSCPGSAGGFTCTMISSTLFEVSGLAHTTVGSVESGCDSPTDIGEVCGTDVGECVVGIIACEKGSKICAGAIGPIPAGELCDNKDNDCDSIVDEFVVDCKEGEVCDDGVCKSSGACVDSKCPVVANGVAGCVGGICGIKSCNTGFGNCNLNNADGCETNTNANSKNCGACGLICKSGEVCSKSVCKKPDGQTCTANSECLNNNCLESQSGKRCTSVSSCGTCKVINTAGTSCVNANPGTDPKSDCSKESEMSCGKTGLCDGSGSCELYSVGTECTASSCTNLGYVPAGECDGAGICISSDSISCDDSNECTVDACDDSSGCVNAAIEDGTPCNFDQGVCSSGVCI